MEVLEGRQLLTASLSPIANVTVPAQLGYQLTLDSGGSTDQTLPRHRVTQTSRSRWHRRCRGDTANGEPATVLDHHRLALASEQYDVTINNESMTFQLFGDLTPQTVDRIATLTNDNYYTTATLLNSSPAQPR